MTAGTALADVASMFKTDDQLRQDVLDELARDPAVDAAHVDVAVAYGVATLDGRVGSWAEKEAAQDAALRIAGIHDVANDLAVVALANPSPTDTEIARAVREALRWDAWVPEKRIRCTVANGVVTLLGTVDSARQRDDAERIVGRLAGVREVQNELVDAREEDRHATCSRPVP